MKEVLKQNVTGVQHIGIPVLDLERSVKFYGELGFEVAMRSEIKEEKGTVYVAMMKFGTIIVELYQAYGEGARELETRKDGHIDHVAINVRNVDEVFAAIKAKGIPTVETAPVFLHFWDNGCKYFAIRGPMNEKIEFNEICC